MIRHKRLVLLLALSPLTTVFAEDPPLKAAVPVPPAVEELYVYTGSNGYAKQLADKGVQGNVSVRAVVAADGTLTAPKISETSRSDELDRLALALVLTFKFKPKKSAAPVTEIIVPILFLKDSLTSLHQKSCAEFNIDYGYFKVTFPEKETGDMTVFKMATGVAFATSGFDMKRVKRLKSATTGTATKCAASPDSKFLDVFLKQLG